MYVFYMKIVMCWWYDNIYYYGVYILLKWRNIGYKKEEEIYNKNIMIIVICCYKVIYIYLRNIYLF